VQPGRLLAGEYPGHPDPAQARHKVDLLVDAGIRTFVDLTTPQDRLDPYRPLVSHVADARQVDLRHEPFPIPDLDVVDDHRYDEVARTIEDGLARGAVYVHCWGGVGRTGTVIGCVLADEGLDRNEVIERLATFRAATRKANRRAPEMPVQHELIRCRATRRR
jgi:protein-tyrosine phosphatase